MKSPKSYPYSKHSGHRAAPQAVGQVCGRLETALGLAADLEARVQLQGPLLIPLLRAAGSVLTVASLPVLQVKAASAHCSPTEGGLATGGRSPMGHSRQSVVGSLSGQLRV